LALTAPVVAAFAQSAGPDRIVLLGTKGWPAVHDTIRFPSSNVLVVDFHAEVTH
jgi:hypothetical protein